MFLIAENTIKQMTLAGGVFSSSCITSMKVECILIKHYEVAYLDRQFFPASSIKKGLSVTPNISYKTGGKKLTT